VAAAAAVALQAAAARTQTPPQEKPQEQRPAATFKSGVDLVAVDVTVVDSDGRPVRDLVPEDFTLTVDGAPRRLVSAQFISQTSELTPAEPPVDLVATNTNVTPGRLIMLVVDQNHIRAGGGKTMIQAASAFIDRLGRSDRVGLALIPGSDQQVDFTSNHALVKSLLAKATGRQTRDVGPMHVGIGEAIEVATFNNEQAFNLMVERECPGLIPGQPDQRYETCLNDLRAESMRVMSVARARTEETLLSLRRILARLASGPEPKSVVLVSEGLILESPVSQLSWVAPIAAAARASLYVLRLDARLFDASDFRIAATANQDQILEAQGLDTLAGLARGASLPVGADAEIAFKRLALELSGYYLISFEPQGADRDGKPHAITVDVRRRGLEVRARRSFSVDPARATLSAEELLTETLRSPLLATEVPLHVTTYTFRDQTADKLRVLITAEIDRRLNPTGDYSLAFVLIDGNNRVAASQMEQSLGIPSPGQEGRPQRYSGAVLVDPGVYTLKLAVLDPEGRRGSIEHSFPAQVQSAGQLRLGDLMLAQLGPGPAPQVRPLVSPDVTHGRLYGYLELYSEATAQLDAASVTFEIATDPNGRALEAGTGRLSPVERGTRSAEGDVPVALLPPGSYVARAIVSVAGRPVARATRPFVLTRELPPAEAPAVAAATSASSPILTAVAGPFRRDRVLAPSVVGYFLDRLFTPDTAATATALRPAIEDAKAGRFEAAAAALDRLDPALAGQLAPTFLRGLTLLAQGRLEDAASRFREAIRLSSEFFPAVFYLGACYAEGGRDREAAGAWQTALVTESESPFVYTLLGEALLRLDEGLSALEIAREARQQWPEDDEVLALEAAALAALGQGRDAIAILDGVVQRHPDDHARLFLAMRVIYETVASGRSIGTPEEDRARFTRYAKAYITAHGPQTAIVEQWQKFIASKGPEAG
jgi:VWFA-related protein